MPILSEDTVWCENRAAPGSKNPNPKEVFGSKKLPIHLWPTTATMLGCLGFLDGARKYGRSNYRDCGVKASIYYDAARRHLDAWFEGEEIDNGNGTEEDPGSGLPHLAHALACIAIIVDVEAAGKLIDDRMFPGGYRALSNKLTPMVRQVQQRHADRTPKHYTIADKP